MAKLQPDVISLTPLELAHSRVGGHKFLQSFSTNNTEMGQFPFRILTTNPISVYNKTNKRKELAIRLLTPLKNSVAYWLFSFLFFFEAPFVFCAETARQFDAPPERSRATTPPSPNGHSPSASPSSGPKRPVADSKNAPEAHADEAFLKSLPPEIQDFIERFKKERPGITFHPKLYEFAQMRAKHCLTVRSGHPHDLNGQVRRFGYQLPRAIPDFGNQLESLWAASNAEGALNGWRGHQPHAVHVFGRTSPYQGHQFFGVGFYRHPGQKNGQWVFISAPKEE